MYLQVTSAYLTLIPLRAVICIGKYYTIPKESVGTRQKVQR